MHTGDMQYALRVRCSFAEGKLGNVYLWLCYWTDASCILVYNIIHCPNVYVQARIFIHLYELVWVVNTKTQSDEWEVHFKSWVIKYTWHDIQTDIIYMT